MSGKATHLIARALQLKPEAVPSDARVYDWKYWDSLAHTQILTELEKTLGRELEPAEIISIEGVADIDALISR